MNQRISNRTKYSLLNAASAIALTLVNGLLGIIVTRLVLSYFGSDFNGLNSTANQIINVLLILEGGFTLASNVALFGALNNGDRLTSNAILKATKNKFERIAGLFFSIGLVIAFVYSIVARTALSRELVFTVIIMTVLPQAFNLYYTTTYRVLLQTQQKEYIISGFTALTIGLGHCVNIILIFQGGQMWMVRFVTMFFALVNCFLITGYTRNRNKFIDFSVNAKPELIKGTNDVMAQKITGVVYTSWPMVFLSISPSGGTMLASVYAVYNNVFVMIKSILHSAIDAPRLGFGQMLTEKRKEEVWSVFKQYEFITLVFTFIMLVTASALILPFITLYTRGVEDIVYYDKSIAILMILIGAVEMIHIPSGHIINMSGNFNISKKFQIIACILLIISMTIFGTTFGVYGMLFSLLAVALLLAILEIGFVHIRFFSGTLFVFIKMIVPFIIFGTIISAIELKLFSSIEKVVHLLFWGAVLMTVNMLIVFFISFIFQRKELFGVIKRGTVLLNNIKK